MGDRSNTFIQMESRPIKYNGEEALPQEWDGIGFYSHWGGTDSQVRAILAARESTDRLGDEAYFARRVIHKLLLAEADADSATGHGLWVTTPCDNEYPILVINANTGMAWLCGDNEYRLDPDEAVHVNDFDLSVLGGTDDDDE
jgi:hypothetical protein